MAGQEDVDLRDVGAEHDRRRPRDDCAASDLIPQTHAAVTSVYQGGF